MKCEDVSKELVSYFDGNADGGVARRDVDEHLIACSDCRVRAAEFRDVWDVLDEMPSIEPSFAFDARVRQRVAAEPRPQWLRWFVVQPRFAFAAGLLLALMVWLVKMPIHRPVGIAPAASTQQEDFNAIEDLGVLENYDVVTKMDVLSELAPITAEQQPPTPQQSQQAGHDNGGA